MRKALCETLRPAGRRKPGIVIVSALAPLRRQLIEGLAQDPNIEIQGWASTVALALRKCAIREPAAIVIGCSTGGPAALEKVIPRLPSGLPVPALVVQHMPPMFTRMLAAQLASESRVKVSEAGDGMPVRRAGQSSSPGPEIVDGRCVRAEPGSAGRCRPAVELLLRSVLEVYGGQVLFVILTGMGQDGLRGVEPLRAAGAAVIAQDQESGVVWGMPGAIVQAGLAGAVHPIEQISDEILSRLPRPASERRQMF